MRLPAGVCSPWRQLTITLVACVLGLVGSAAPLPAVSRAKDETRKVVPVNKRLANARVFEEQLIPKSFVELVAIATVDRDALAIEDAGREAAGLAPRFAVPNAVRITPETHGNWEEVGDSHLIWRLNVFSAGASSINLGFTRYFMPEGGRLYIHTPDHSASTRPFTAADNAEHRQLWTPILPGEDAVLEITIPQGAREQLEIELTSINVGYRGFGDPTRLSKSGACNNDVVCPEGIPWADEISSVAVFSTGGFLFCTGFMVNNTAQDQTPNFMTASHCEIDAGNAASLVVYWNYETSVCGGTPDGQLNDFQTGSFFRASYAPSDFTLVELDSAPLPSWGVTFAGWDRSPDASTTSSAVAIHHPSSEEKRISFENDPTRVTSYYGTYPPGDGTHVRVVDWDDGTTERGSSGSPLFDPNHRVIGQLHGGDAACGNNESDWYGRFFTSWTGGGTPATRLSDWLDPGNTGATFVDTLVPGGTSDPNEPNNDFGSATGIGCPSHVTTGAEIAPLQDLDHYVLTAAPGATVEIDIDAAQIGSTLDSVIAAFDSSFTLLASSDDAAAPGEPATLDSYLSIAAPADGIVYIVVTSHDDTDFNGGTDAVTTGFYSMTVTSSDCPEDPNEPNDSIGVATPVVCPTYDSTNAEIDPLGDLDYYVLTAGPGAVVEIDIDAQELGSSLDPLIGAFNSSLNLIASNDDGAAPGEPLTLDSYLSITAPADGIIYIAVTSSADSDFNGGGDASTTGFYEMSVTASLCLPPDPNEPNDSVPAATSISCPSFDSATASIDPAEDLDYYLLSGSPGTTVRIDIDASQNGSTLDPLLGTWDSAFNPIAISDDSAAPGEPSTRDSYLEVTMPADGLLYIAVTSFADFDFDGGGDHSSTGPYDMHVTCSNEPNDDFGTATPIPCPSSRDVEINPAEDVDYYLLSGSPGATVRIDVDAADNGSTLDPMLGAWDSGFNQLGFSDDDPAPGEPSTLDSYVVVTLPADGLLYIAVTAYNDIDFDGGTDHYGIGPYTLHVDCDDEPNDNFSTAALVTCRSSLDREVDPAGDVDYYLLSGTPGSTVMIDIDAAENGSTLDPLLGTWDSSLTPIAISDDSPAPGEPSTLDSYLEVILPADGLLYIAVTAYNDIDFDGGGDHSSTGPYVLHVSCSDEPNDDFGTATPILYPASLDRRIDPAGDVDFYLLNGPPGSTVLIDIDASQYRSTLDSLLGAWDTGFNQLGFSDDDPAPGELSSLDSYLEVMLPADGLLYVAVTSFSDFEFDGGANHSSTGPYTLQMFCLSEPNEGFGTATPILCDLARVDTLIGPADDLDFYVLSGVPGVTVALDIDAAELGSTLDPVLGTWDSSFAPITFSDDNAAPGEPFTRDSYLQAVMPGDGLMYVAVSSYSDFGFDGGSDHFTTGDYSMLIECGCADSDLDAVCNQDDNCPFVHNPGQGPVHFPEPILARGYCSADPDWTCLSDGHCPSGSCVKAAFQWTTVLGVEVSIGAFVLSSDVGTYDAIVTEGLVGNYFFDLLGDPASRSANWYLVRDDCSVGSWQNGPGTEAQRDEILP